MASIESADSLQLTHAILGKLYAQLTGDNSELFKARRHFFTWMTPGMTFDPDEWNYMLGGAGPTAPASTDTAEAGDGVTDASDAAGGGADAPASGDGTQSPAGTGTEGVSAAEVGRFATAFTWGRVFNFVPDVSGLLDYDEQQSTMFASRLGVTVPGAYEYVLDHCEIAKEELSTEAEAQIKKLRAALLTQTEITDDAGEPMLDPISGEPMVVEQPSKIYKAYQEYMQKYHTAWLELQRLKANAMSGDPAAESELAFMGPVVEQQVQAAFAAWESLGFRTRVESWQAEIARLGMQSTLAYWQEARGSFERTEIKTVAGDFHWTQVAPVSAIRSPGWTRFRFTESDYETFRQTKTQEASASAGLDFFGLSLGKAKGESAEKKSVGKLNWSGFELSFELLELPIIRFDMNFLFNERWRLPDGEVLSDGGTPPKGRMVAWPAFVVLVRDLTLSFAELQDESSSFTKSISGGTTGFAIGPLNLGGDYSRGEKQTHHNRHRQGQSVVAPGTQVVGFRCQLAPRMPDPAEGISEWVAPNAGQ